MKEREGERKREGEKRRGKGRKRQRKSVDRNTDYDRHKWVQRCVHNKHNKLETSNNINHEGKIHLIWSFYWQKECVGISLCM